jgi:AcrR family transcriptional regulator
MSAQERRRNEAEQRLLDAAAELIGEIGPAAVTLANIGERAGYSRGLATHHFGSKGAMMHRLVANVTDEFNLAIFGERPKGSAADDLQAPTSAVPKASSSSTFAASPRTGTAASRSADGSEHRRPQPE